MKKQETTRKRWFVHCDYCSYSRIFEQADDLVEIKTSPIPGGSPELNAETKRAEPKPALQQIKKIKCPTCGRGTTVKKLPNVYSKAFKQIDDEERKQNEEAEKERRIKDGLPIKRPPDEGTTPFLG